MAFDLIAVGDVMLDGALPEPVPGRRIHGHLALRVGGSAANAALAAASRGAHAAVVGRVGSDPAGKLVEQALVDGGVVPLLAHDQDAPTGCVVVAGSAIVADPGASARLSPDDVPGTLAAGAVLVSGYSLLLPGPEAAARAALARSAAQWLAVDAASRGLVESFGAARFFAATERADVLLANEEEARALTGLDAEEAVRTLAGRYRVACVKLGPAGAIAAADGAVVAAPAQPFEPDGALGAGDAFAAGFLIALAAAQPLEAALVQGCAAAAARSRDLARSGPRGPA